MRQSARLASVVVALTTCTGGITACSSSSSGGGGNPSTKDASADASSAGGKSSTGNAGPHSDTGAPVADAGQCPSAMPVNGTACGILTASLAPPVLCNYAGGTVCACGPPAGIAGHQLGTTMEWDCAVCPATQPAKGAACLTVFGNGATCPYGPVQCACGRGLSLGPPGWDCGNGSFVDDAGSFDTSGGPTDPIPTKPLEWVWVPFPDSKCRDGSMAGIQINANPASDNVMIFLEQGGACWNQATCTKNPANFLHSQYPISTGVFDRTNVENPVKDWNIVYVPYCTGDVHAGNNPGFDPGGGVGPQQYVGYTNLQKFLGRIVPTFPSAKKVLHTGSSAGGFGSLLTVELVGKSFPSTVDVVLVDDSGPAMSDPWFASCVQHANWTTWGFDKTFLADCGADCPHPDNYLLEYPEHLAKAYPNRRYGIIEAIDDATIASYFNFGANNCTGDPTVFPSPMDAATFQAGLLDFRTRIATMTRDGGTSNFGTFYPAGTKHMCLVADLMYTYTAGGVNLINWFTGIVNGAAPSNAGP